MFAPSPEYADFAQPPPMLVDIRRTMRTATIATLVAVALSTSSLAYAAGKAKRTAKPNTRAPVMVAAAAEPLPTLPAVETTSTRSSSTLPSSAAPSSAGAKDAPAAESAKAEPVPAGRGFVMVIGSGLGFVGGEMGKDLSMAAGLVTFDLKFGAYVTTHFGIMAGLQAGYGALFEGCRDTCTNAIHYQLPIVAQYAFQDRSRGAYIEGGLGLFSTYLASTNTSSNPEKSPEALEVASPIDFKLGVGYRFPDKARPNKAATGALDLRFGVDLGTFKKLEYQSVGLDVAGDIPSDLQAMHFALGLSAGYHFAP